MNNSINQNTFFNINNIKNDIIPKVSPVLEVSNTKDSNIINSNLRNIDRRNVKLDNYYKRYIKRDNNYILESEFSNYFIETLPKKFDLDPQINQQANDLMDNKIKETGAQIFPNNINMIHEVDEEKLKEENTDNLKILINSLFNNMENKNTYKNGKQDEYYTSIKELLGFNKLVKNAKDIDNKPKTEIEKFNKRNLNNQINEELNEEDKNDLLNKNKNINEINTNSNINNVDIKIGGDKNDIKSDVILTDIKEVNLEDMLNDNNKINQNEKLRNPQNDIKKNYIQNVNMNIFELNKNPNNVIIETLDRKQNNNLDQGYSSAKHGVSPTDNNNTNINFNNTNNNDKNLDQGYSSAKHGVSPTDNNTTINFNNTNNSDKNLDQGYSSSKDGINNNINNINNNKINEVNNTSISNQLNNNTNKDIQENNDNAIKEDKEEEDYDDFDK